MFALQSLLGYARRAIQKYDMIPPGSSVAVGLSGGKDSVALLCVLARLRTVLPGGFSLTALTIDARFGGSDTDYSPMEALCRDLEVPYRIERTDIGAVVFEARKEKNPCSLCAHMRRGALCRASARLGASRLALAHHADDALETFVMNLERGQLACFSPVTYLEDRGITLIRPFCAAPEKAVSRAVRRSALPVVSDPCPLGGETRRGAIKAFLLCREREDPGLKERMLGALQRGHLSGW